MSQLSFGIVMILLGAMLVWQALYYKYRNIVVRGISWLTGVIAIGVGFNVLTNTAQASEVVKEAVKQISTPDMMDKIVMMTKNFIEAATPVAKQAYEIGLLTLQIDALSVLLPMTILWCFGLYLVIKYGKTGTNIDTQIRTHQCKLRDDWKLSGNERYSIEKAIKILENEQKFYVLPLLGGGILVLFTSFWVFSTWLWVKLFKPELWLAHMAVEKVMGN
jgi:hypothetical protein